MSTTARLKAWRYNGLIPADMAIALYVEAFNEQPLLFYRPTESAAFSRGMEAFRLHEAGLTWAQVGERMGCSGEQARMLGARGQGVVFRQTYGDSGDYGTWDFRLRRNRLLRKKMAEEIA